MQQKDFADIADPAQQGNHNKFNITWIQIYFHKLDINNL